MMWWTDIHHHLEDWQFVYAMLQSSDKLNSCDTRSANPLELFKALQPHLKVLHNIRINCIFYLARPTHKSKISPGSWMDLLIRIRSIACCQLSMDPFIGKRSIAGCQVCMNRYQPSGIAYRFAGTLQHTLWSENFAQSFDIMPVLKTVSRHYRSQIYQSLMPKSHFLTYIPPADIIDPRSISQ